MRLALFLLFLAALSFSINVTVTRYMNVSTSTSCPGDWLFMNATDSEGNPAPDVELRLVLYEPYQGLRALEHTDQNGLASVQLTNTGHFRLYIYTNDYDHDQYVEFDYPARCPPPPPKTMNITVTPDCADNLLVISAASGGAPLSGVVITTPDWSSMSGDSGNVSFPLEEGDIFINASKTGYSNPQFYYTVSCAPPPECTDDAACGTNQSCVGGRCENLSGTCGYPENHTWVHYTCCSDSDCGSTSMCLNNTCVLRPALPATNQTILPNPSTTNQTKPRPPSGTGTCPIGAALLVAILLLRKS
jgi:hypothetical protein